MKTKSISLIIVAMFIATTFSCKGDKKNDTEATAAEEVKASSTEAVIYVVDSSSSIAWVGKKPAGQHTGTLKVAKGTISIKEDHIESGSFIIDMTSINVTDLDGEEKAGLEGHLKGEGEEKDHFFNVAKFPTASFEITGIAPKEGKTFIEGNLTIKGITKNISFPASTSKEGSTMTLTTESFTINRTDWGVNYASKSIFGDLGDKFINDDIELKINLKATKG